MAEREAAGLPPYGRLAALILSSEDAAALERLAQRAGGGDPQCRAAGGLRPRRRAAGPDPRPAAQAASWSAPTATSTCRASCAAWRARVKVPGSVRLTVDVDPYSFL